MITDCFIRSVHYVTVDGSRQIEKVRAISGNKEPVSQREFTRLEIIDIIDNDVNVTTASYDNKVGAKVIVHKVNGKRFIKTVANNTEDDNLGELPTY